MIKQCKTYTDYYVDDIGNVYSNKYDRFKLLVASYRNNYKYVPVRLNNKTIRVAVHRLIYEGFNDLIPEKFVINHINGIKDDNRIINLECVTKRQNGQCQNKTRNSKTGEHNIQLEKKTKRFKVVFKIDGSVLYFGLYKNMSEAIKVRDHIDYCLLNNLPIERSKYLNKTTSNRLIFD